MLGRAVGRLGADGHRVLETSLPMEDERKRNGRKGFWARPRHRLQRTKGGVCRCRKKKQMLTWALACVPVMVG